MKVLDRFLGKVICLDEDQGGCWEWQGGRFTSGYAAFKVKNYSSTRAHRWSYEYFTGPILSHLEIDHLCRNKGCVNPDHLEAVTARVNQRRSDSPTGINSRKTHCSKGHPFSSDNTYVCPKGKRVCRECHRRKERIRIWNKRHPGDAS